MKHGYKRERFDEEQPSRGDVICWNFHHDDWRVVRVLSDKGYPLLSGDWELVGEIIR